MKHLLIILISFLLLSSPVIGQSGKPLGVIFPPTIMGNVSDSRQQILLNTLDDEISQYFDVSPRTNVSSGELPLVEDVFQLQIVEEDGDTQLSLRWTSGNERKVETILCGGCKTKILNDKVKGLVENLFREKGVLYELLVDGEWGWYKSGDEKKGNKYVGEIVNGKPNGQGKLTYPIGSKYVGEFKDGGKHGQGTLIYSDGKKEVGKFKESTFWLGKKYDENGKFTLYTFQGGDYVGELKDGLPNGQGKLTWFDREYDGGFKDGVFHGRGTENWSDGVHYLGEFKDGKYHGQGTYTYSDGVKYFGEFKDGSPNGNGTFNYPNGDKYVGNFKDWELHGQGESVLYSVDGAQILEEYVGEYKEGLKHGQGTETFPDVNKYIGEFKEGLRHGQGTETFPDGDKYIGEFKEGLRHGQGTETWSNGKRFIGEYKEGGSWNVTFYEKNGNIIGKFVNGKYIKQ